jgi:hypothetical protein
MLATLYTLKVVLLALGVSFTTIAGVIHLVELSRPYVLVWKKKQDGPDNETCVESFDKLDDAQKAYKAIAKTDVKFKLLMNGACSVVAKYGDLKQVDEALNRCYYG